MIKNQYTILVMVLVISAVMGSRLDKIKDRMQTTVIKGDLVLHHMKGSSNGFSKSNCDFRVTNGGKEVLSTVESKDDFLQVGLGNIDDIEIISDGDINSYPVPAYSSWNQTCLINATGILSRVQVPLRSGDPSKNFATMYFKTTITPTALRSQVRVFTTQITNYVQYDFLKLTFDSSSDEQVFGMGLQYTHTNFKGKKVQIITSEGGVGRGLEPLTSLLNSQPQHQGGSEVTTYAPSYTFTTSHRRGLVMKDHTELGIIDFTQRKSFSVLLWKPKKEINTYVISGDSLKDVVSGITNLTGRMKALPAWTQEGAIVGLQGGQEKVDKQYTFLKSQGVPIKAVWMQDWVGTFKFPEGVRLLWNWQLNRKHYNNWDNMIANWKAEGVRPMVYMNPYFANLTGNPEIRTNYFKIGDKNGYFLKDKHNKTYLIQSLSIQFAMIDFSNPAAVKWAEDLIINNMLEEASAVGWMADFGEYTPMDISPYNRSGEDVHSYHNKYPLEWAQTNQRAVSNKSDYNETVYFMRSGSTESPGATSLMWMGDQLPTFDKYDGLHSALIGLLNGGYSGMGIGHSDIGGYTSLNDTQGLQYYRRDYEILMRWCEMSAFSDAVFRTHPSNNPDFNAQIWDNAEIAQFFKKFAQIHSDLGEYRMQLMREMEFTGVPIVRSLSLELNRTDINIDDQFMLGSEYLVAPIFKQGSTSRKVYFPQGEWQHYFTKDIIKGTDSYQKVRAPLGEPAVFKRITDDDINKEEFMQS